MGASFVVMEFEYETPFAVVSGGIGDEEGMSMSVRIIFSGGALFGGEVVGITTSKEGS